MNVVTLVGRLTKNPEVRYSTGADPKAICQFTLAVDRESREGGADFIRCVVFGKQAEAMERYISKGKQVAVKGSIRTGSYEGNDGKTHYTVDVYASRVEFIGSKSDDKPAPKNGQANMNQNAIPEGYEVIDDSDIPF